MKAVILDIEGTTTDINFVYNVLFPYAKKALPEFLKNHKDDDSVNSILLNIKSKFNVGSDDEILSLLNEWIETDQKIKELKDLQGLIWIRGYEQKDYISHLYPDVLPQIKKWKESGMKVYIYSSGSIQAQKLLFSHTEYGDVTNLLDGYFDTTIGNKREEKSYANILEHLELAGNEVTFLSDIEAELTAAKSVGINVFHVNRDGLYNDSKYKLITEFSDIGDF